MRKINRDLLKPEELIKQGIEKIGLDCGPGQLDAFVFYLSELNKWNRAYNLTGLRSDSDIITKNFLDSLLFLRALPQDIASLADIGSGAGFPGIPIKIMRPQLKTTLIEPTQKKCAFLRHLRHGLGLSDIEVLNRRVEDVSGISVDAAVTRALFSISEMIKKTKHIMNKNGVLVLSKGPKIELELSEAGPLDISVMDIDLPFENTTRHLVIIRP
ncbi:MAG: 16S rRNA (guanine(527)-N(7))-methyltransferase RsmG [Nitrospirae bacterium]|nr:16S rRNA (guanine(527)-N(7))-methyltransferase RsmG [Nitrospirota bacterium]